MKKKGLNYTSLIWGFCLFILVMIISQPVEAVTLEVGPAGYPFTSIQAAIDAAISGVDEILVHDGTYVESISFLGKAIIVWSENGPETTIIDGGKKGCVVIFESGEGIDSVLDGFTITNGRDDHGAGIHCIYSSPTITGCVIKHNVADYNGGGIFCNFSSSPLVVNCVIEKNTSLRSGGGIFSGDLDSSPIIDNCTISQNTATNEGGGILYQQSSASKITNCTIIDNMVLAKYGMGGGIYFGDYCSPEIIHCVIAGNSVEGIIGRGGGIYCRNYSLLTIIDSTITENWAGNQGGGIFCGISSSVVSNSVFLKNNAQGYPNEIYLNNQNAMITINYSNINPSLITGLGVVELSDNTNPGL